MSLSTTLWGAPSVASAEEGEPATEIPAWALRATYPLSEGGPLAPSPRWDIPVTHDLVLLLTLRTTEAWLWPNPFADVRLAVVGRAYEQAFTVAPKWDASRAPFEWDGDRWQINVVGHGLLGSELYLRGRSCELGVAPSLALATTASAAWEYLLEGSAVRPSAIDLVFTPLAGLLLGEARYRALLWSESLSPRPRVIVRYLFDPFGQLERAMGAGC